MPMKDGGKARTRTLVQERREEPCTTCGEALWLGRYQGTTFKSNTVIPQGDMWFSFLPSPAKSGTYGHKEPRNHAISFKVRWQLICGAAGRHPGQWWCQAVLLLAHGPVWFPGIAVK